MASGIRLRGFAACRRTDTISSASGIILSGFHSRTTPSFFFSSCLVRERCETGRGGGAWGHGAPRADRMCKCACGFARAVGRGHGEEWLVDGGRGAANCGACATEAPLFCTFRWVFICSLSLSLSPSRAGASWAGNHRAGASWLGIIPALRAGASWLGIIPAPGVPGWAGSPADGERRVGGEGIGLWPRRMGLGWAISDPSSCRGMHFPVAAARLLVLCPCEPDCLACPSPWRSE